EMHILKCIADNPGITVTKIAFDYAKTKGAISQILKKLIEKKLIIQKPSEEQGDNRIFLYISERGKELNACHIAYDELHAGETLDMVRKEFSPEQIDTAFDVLKCWLECRRNVHENRRKARMKQVKADLASNQLKN
ncbi:MAG: MarR family transcriptional regulator, partial [Eubacterium sp.]|nr:MarR family transcriptional regulator [Eubacterium sp.]